jgi:hypothetical protein
MRRKLTFAQAERLLEGVEVPLDPRICFACLSIVSMTLDGGRSAAIHGCLRQMTPWLWEDGLEEVALDALRAADAHEALAELEEHGARSAVARVIVRDLALELARNARTTMAVERLARRQVLLDAAEWN